MGHESDVSHDKSRDSAKTGFEDILKALCPTP